MFIEGNDHSIKENKNRIKLISIFLFLLLIFMASITISGTSQAAELTNTATTPKITTVDPANGTTNVAANKNIKVTFNETIKNGTNWIEFKNNAGAAIPFKTSIKDNVLTIDPTSNLAESRYELILHAGCVTDLEDNPSAGKIIYFSVGTSPLVTSSNPVNKAFNVVTSKTITVTFNEAIKKGSNCWIELRASIGALININKFISGKVLTITHSKLLKSNTKYTLALHTGCVTDLAGNPLKSKTISFTSIYILDSSVGGDVLKNPEINHYIPKTNFSKEIFTMLKQGSVVLKFGNGNGPKLLISAGIHGNEPEANIAVMKFLEYIKDKSFKGTLYVIPFDIPQDTAKNTRYYHGFDPNRVAKISGTPGWKIVKFAQNNGINYVLDVHSGSEVSKYGFIFLNTKPTIQEKTWASYIKSKTNCSNGSNGADSSGMIRDCTHSLGINSITLEVERDSTPTIVAAETEFKMIKAAAQKLGFIPIGS